MATNPTVIHDFEGTNLEVHDHILGVSPQGHDSGLDADKLDGKHLQDILDEITELEDVVTKRLADLDDRVENNESHLAFLNGWLGTMAGIINTAFEAQETLVNDITAPAFEAVVNTFLTMVETTVQGVIDGTEFVINTNVGVVERAINNVISILNAAASLLGIDGDIDQVILDRLIIDMHISIPEISIPRLNAPRFATDLDTAFEEYQDTGNIEPLAETGEFFGIDPIELFDQ